MPPRYLSLFTSVLTNWLQEAARFVPDLPSHLYHGARRDLEGAGQGGLVVTSYGLSLSPGNELNTMFASPSADSTGSRNLSGIQDPVVDALSSMISQPSIKLSVVV